MNTKPSSYLPAWALRYFERHRDRFDDPEEMSHRRKYFYRLLCAKDSDENMRRMWERAARFISDPTVCHFIPGPDAADSHVTDTDMEAESFICALLFAADETIEDTPAKPARQPRGQEIRLREPNRRAARKLARLLREWRLVTPPRCIAKNAPAMQHAGSLVESLVAAYGFELEPPDLRDIYSRHGIEYTADSKRGWRARRRASDTVRARVIMAAQKLLEIGRPQDAGEIARLSYNLRLLPDLKIEHADEPELCKQKSGWTDWLRVANVNLKGVGERDGFLRHDDWSALVYALYDVLPEKQSIGAVLNESK